MLKFLPLLLVGTVGWFFVSAGNFGAFNASGGSLYAAIGLATGIALFSFIGVETAAITARRVRDPGRNVGRASVIGTVASAILYLLVSAAVMGMVPHHALVGNGAPFVTAFETIFHHAGWAGKLVAAEAVISGIGALNGWTLVTTEASRALANDDLFPRAFTWADRNDNAWFGIIIAALLPSVLMAWRYASSTRFTVFTYLVALTVVTVALPYLFSALAQLSYLVSRRRRVQGHYSPVTCPSPGPRHCSRCGSPAPPATRPSTRPWFWYSSVCWLTPSSRPAESGSVKPPSRTTCPPGTARRPRRSQALSCRGAVVPSPPQAPSRAWPVLQLATTEAPQKNQAGVMTDSNRHVVHAAGV